MNVFKLFELKECWSSQPFVIQPHFFAQQLIRKSIKSSVGSQNHWYERKAQLVGSLLGTVTHLKQQSKDLFEIY